MLISIEYLLRNIPNDYSYKRKYLDENAEKIEVLFLGNSHIYYGIDPVFMRKKSFNAAHYSQTLEFDYRIFHKYQKKLKHLKYVVIGLDDYTFYSKMKTSTECWREKYYNIYYSINSSFLLKNNFELAGGKFQDNIKRIICHFLKNKKYIMCSQLGWLKNTQTSLPNNIRESTIKASERHKILTKDFLKENLNYLKIILGAANENNFTVILLSTPVTKDYFEYLENKNIEKNRIILNDIIKNNKTIYYNYTTDSAFDYDDFFDSDHLNEKGAKKFSLKVNQLLH